MSPTISGSFTERDLQLTKHPMHRRHSVLHVWGGFDQYAPENDRSLLQKSPKKETISAKETCNFKEPTNRSHPIAFEITTRLTVEFLRVFALS